MKSYWIQFKCPVCGEEVVRPDVAPDGVCLIVSCNNCETDITVRYVPISHQCDTCRERAQCLNFPITQGILEFNLEDE